MKRCTKIVATLGPSSEDKKTLTALVKAGMNTARLNCSHGNEKQFTAMVRHLRAIEKETGKTVLTLLDLQGPKIRLGEIPAEGILVKHGETLTFWTGKTLSKGRIPIPYTPLLNILKPGHPLLIEDGLIRTKILSIKGENIRAKVEVGGLLKRHKGVNIPDSVLPSNEALSKKDRSDLKMGIQKLRVDAVALSFVEKAQDILHVRKLIEKWTKKRILLIAKIERPRALQNLKEIATVSDGLMVARGDLGIEIPAEQVPIEQRRILAVGRELGKPVIVATQVLESMTDSPLPTRAEMSDAATAVFEQADAFMLSNESAIGKYPVEAVETLARVAQTVEKAMDSKDLSLRAVDLQPLQDKNEDHELAKEAVELAEKLHAPLVLLTHEGYTARTVLRLRPPFPLFILTPSKSAARRLHFEWGTEEIIVEKKTFKNIQLQKILKKKLGKGSIVTLSLSKTKDPLSVIDL